MESRREFLKKAALLSGAVASKAIPESILKALAIDPDSGSTYLDAEHIVILMQENRSFDHAYGTLRGVRGFNDPRAHVLPNGNPVWLQTNGDGETFAPFRLNIKETNVTWMGSLPHSWRDQVEALNGGRYDTWLKVKPSGYKGFEKKPMTLGHYTREDIPFYYSFADAFTVCDQHFCSSLTGTTPNRLYLWTGTIRPEQSPNSKPHVYNEEADHEHEVSWKTFPERLEDAGISWRIYQNELDIPSGLSGLEDAWLGNYGDNAIEYFSQFNVRFSARHRAHLQRRKDSIPGEISKLQADASADRTKEIAQLRSELDETLASLERWSADEFESLSPRDKRLHQRAFCVNEGDSAFRSLETLTYRDGGNDRTVQVPKGDILHQFRLDVESGNLPTVSWLVGPQEFSDHPSSAWYGAWYVSEALDILTSNEAVWKKTIFILTYDENDGYFDHIPPFVAPNPAKSDSGKVSKGIDAAVEYVTKEQDGHFRPHYKAMDSSIGLGYRVPMVVASPWSRGGCVCSEVFDHTSVLQFLEVFLTHKTGKPIREENLSAWRRTVCGDLTASFRPFDGSKAVAYSFRSRDEFVEQIHRAKFKSPPSNIVSLSPEAVEQIRLGGRPGPFPDQESGTRASAPLSYELMVDGVLNGDRSSLEVSFVASNARFGSRSLGAPFNAYAYGTASEFSARSYAVSPGDALKDSWILSNFESGGYHVRVDGPNGFMREFLGNAGDPDLAIHVGYARGLSGSLEIHVHNKGSKDLGLLVKDTSYGAPAIEKMVGPNSRLTFLLETKLGSRWYDLEVGVRGYNAFTRRYAGRVETGEWGMSDPSMGEKSVRP